MCTENMQLKKDSCLSGLFRNYLRPTCGKRKSVDIGKRNKSFTRELITSSNLWLFGQIRGENSSCVWGGVIDRILVHKTRLSALAWRITPEWRQNPTRLSTRTTGMDWFGLLFKKLEPSGFCSRRTPADWSGPLNVSYPSGTLFPIYVCWWQVSTFIISKSKWCRRGAICESASFRLDNNTNGHTCPQHTFVRGRRHKHTVVGSPVPKGWRGLIFRRNLQNLRQFRAFSIFFEHGKASDEFLDCPQPAPNIRHRVFFHKSGKKSFPQEK